MSSLAYRDYITFPYHDFDEKINLTKKGIAKEMSERFGKRKKYNITDLGICFLVDYKSEKAS